MTAFMLIMKILGACTTLYILLIMTRILLTWFPYGAGGRSRDLLVSVTDPYLNLFRRVPFLRSSSLDFSPIAALAVLGAALQLFTAASRFGKVSVGLILAVALGAMWSVFSFLFSFFGIAMAARLVAYLAHWSSLHPIWRVVDTLISPVLARLTRMIYGERIVNYRQGLITGILTCFGLWFLGGRLVNLGERLLVGLPF